ncbi:hypothetical protein HT031_001369 [Scenedesmus sp. PABB004]|nr:hypothetical protein HT031_001369 [Scenedesmus sp. PABB004]
MPRLLLAVACLLAAAAATAHAHGHHHHRHHRHLLVGASGPAPSCSTPEPFADDAARARVMKDLAQRIASARAIKGGGGGAGAGVAFSEDDFLLVNPDGATTVPVAVTIVEPAGPIDKERYYATTDRSADVTQLLAALNAAYSGALSRGDPPTQGRNTAFRFKLCSLRVVNVRARRAPRRRRRRRQQRRARARRARGSRRGSRRGARARTPPRPQDNAFYTSQTLDEADRTGRATNRRGNRGTLNLFVKPLNLAGAGTAAPPEYCSSTWPWWFVTGGPNNDFRDSDDGVAVDGAYVLPGASWIGTPGTAAPGRLAHDVGHWIGALHTFQSTTIGFNNNCSVSGSGVPDYTFTEDKGDMCSDTPVHVAPLDALDADCDTNDERDSCRIFPGLDPQFNIMNLVKPECMVTLSQCQRDWLDMAYDSYRTSSSAPYVPKLASMSFTDVATSGPTALNVAPFITFPTRGRNPADPAPSLPDLEWGITKKPSKGVLSLAPNGTLLYTPNAGAAGTDVFELRVMDCVGASQPATATISFFTSPDQDSCPETGLPPCRDRTPARTHPAAAAAPGRAGELIDGKPNCEASFYCTLSASGSNLCQYGIQADDFVCNKTSGGCETDALCDGINVACPAKALLAPGTVCKKAEDPCENDAKCKIKDPNCPASTFKQCTGNGLECPPDVSDVCTGFKCPTVLPKSDDTACVIPRGGVLASNPLVCPPRATGKVCVGVGAVGDFFKFGNVDVKCVYNVSTRGTVCARSDNDECTFCNGSGASCAPSSDTQEKLCANLECPTTGLPACVNEGTGKLLEPDAPCTISKTSYCDWLPVQVTAATTLIVPCQYQYRPKGFECAPSAGKSVCDVADTCRGNSAVCTNSYTSKKGQRYMCVDAAAAADSKLWTPGSTPIRRTKKAGYEQCGECASGACDPNPAGGPYFCETSKAAGP